MKIRKVLDMKKYEKPSITIDLMSKFLEEKLVEKENKRKDVQKYECKDTGKAE